MKLDNLYFILILFLFPGNVYSQISSGKTSYTFNNAPILSIEKISFEDENKNGFADAGEQCYFLVKLKNSGKSDAKSVNMKISTDNPSQNELNFEKSFAVGNLKINEIKEVKIPVQANTSFENVQITFELVARELNNYDAKPVEFVVQVKALEAGIAINWSNPKMMETTVEESRFLLNACIISAIKVEEVELYVNNILYKPVRGFKLTKTDDCNNYFEQEIMLGRGNNLLQLKARNKSKKVESEVRNIIFNDPQFEYRTALVIGNSKYDDAPLKNSANDARSMSEALRELNFDVIEIIEGDLPTIRQGIRDFFAKLEENHGVGLFYYAGHGVQSKGENYIVPIHHDIKEEFEIPDRAVRVSAVLEAMESTNTRMNIVILDACRNNPFMRSFRSTSRGLAPINAQGTGSIIAYATAPGSVASDGTGENGLFTQELLKAIKTPGLEIGMVFRNVLANVRKLSNGQQLPWTNQSIEGEFYFIK